MTTTTHKEKKDPPATATLHPIRLKIAPRDHDSEEKLLRLRESVLGVFVARLKEQEEDNLLKIVLFGSVARGDSGPDSDINVFILVKKDIEHETSERISDISVDINLEGNASTQLSPFIQTLEEYNKYCRYFFTLQDVKNEGIVLYDSESHMTLHPIRLKTAPRDHDSEEKLLRLRESVLEVFVARLKEQKDDNLLKIVLFGSVARGDCKPDSDIDVFILVKEDIEHKTSERISDISVDINLERNASTQLSPFVQTLEQYTKSPWLPVYQAIREEGMVLYDAELH